jgi:hypothetical protein
MIFMLICTEGDVSEPEFINALVRMTGGQAPRSVSTNIEVLPLPLGGNQGHTRLVEAANEAVAKYGKEGLISLADENDTIEKWIIVDHDDMEDRNMNPQKLREEAQGAGYTLIISKPNFEFFVLAALSDLATARATKSDQFVGEINSRIDSLNQKDKDEKGFGKDMLMPHYSKKKYVAEKLFGFMLGHHPELIDEMASLEVDVAAEGYSEMPEIVRRINDLYKG